MSTPRSDLAFKIHGMDCAEEVEVLKQEVGPVVGGADRLAFDILNARMTVLPGPVEVSEEAVRRAVGRTGMRAEPWRGGPPDPRGEGFRQRRRRTALTGASGLFALAGFLFHAWSAGG